MIKETYMYDYLIENDFNIYNFDISQRKYRKKIKIKKVDILPLPTNYDTKIEDRVAEIYVHKDYKYFLYKNGIRMNVNKDLIQIFTPKNIESLIKDRLLYRLSIGHGILALLRLNKNFILHGTCLNVGGKNISILAPSRTGKTTLSAGLLKYKDVHLVSDDKTVINGNDLNVLYGSSVMRIWDDSAKVIFPNINTSELQEANYLGKKYLDTCKIKNKHSYKSGNINDLYFLREKKGCLDIEVKKMSKSQLFTELVKQIDNINTLSFKEINDEINNITKLVNSNVNGYYIDFEHNFEKINNFINEMYLIIKGIN